MPRPSLAFTLSSAHALPALLLELALHEGVAVRVEGQPDRPTVVVTTDDSDAALWDVRATVKMFDEGAVELPDLGADPSQ